jgi:hypothetical protein
LAQSVYAQDEFESERRQAWKAFEKKGWDKFDYTKKKITKAQLAKIKSDGVIDELALFAEWFSASAGEFSKNARFRIFWKNKLGINRIRRFPTLF